MIGRVDPLAPMSHTVTERKGGGGKGNRERGREERERKEWEGSGVKSMIMRPRFKEPKKPNR